MRLAVCLCAGLRVLKQTDFGREKAEEKKQQDQCGNTREGERLHPVGSETSFVQDQKAYDICRGCTEEEYRDIGRGVKAAENPAVSIKQRCDREHPGKRAKEFCSGKIGKAFPVDAVFRNGKQ